MRVIEALKKFAGFVKKSTIFGAYTGAFVGAGFNGITYRNRFLEAPKAAKSNKKNLEDGVVEFGSYAYAVCDGAIEGAKGGTCLGLAVGLAPVWVPALTFMAYTHRPNNKALIDMCKTLEQSEEHQNMNNPDPLKSKPSK